MVFERLKRLKDQWNIKNQEQSKEREAFNKMYAEEYKKETAKQMAKSAVEKARSEARRRYPTGKARTGGRFSGLFAGMAGAAESEFGGKEKGFNIFNELGKTGREVAGMGSGFGNKALEEELGSSRGMTPAPSSGGFGASALREELGIGSAPRRIVRHKKRR